ncbi:hypothetical protein CDAR_568651 [Caerostris darwini]|uniref:Uncharacterized protein n=1 Tax=Caerostris darwini TaxID=1538125 RepID=A0AAV4W472_9ARAC|nr:hypothetical protein CDAR_568651 [Caerostris darwini]
MKKIRIRERTVKDDYYQHAKELRGTKGIRTTKKQKESRVRKLEIESQSSMATVSSGHRQHYFESIKLISKFNSIEDDIAIFLSLFDKQDPRA